MKIAIVGGMSRLETHYQEEARRHGYELNVFNTDEAHLLSRIRGSGAVILFTDKVSHGARNKVVAFTKAEQISLIMKHSSGVCAFRDCLNCIAKNCAAREATPARSPATIRA